MKLQTVLLFFCKFCASKSGVRLIYGCGLYTDVYGIHKKAKEKFHHIMSKIKMIMCKCGREKSNKKPSEKVFDCERHCHYATRDSSPEERSPH